MSERDRYSLASSLLSQSLSVPLSHHSVKMKKHRGSEYPPICAALPDEDDCPNLKHAYNHDIILLCNVMQYTCFCSLTTHSILAILGVLLDQNHNTVLYCHALDHPAFLPLLVFSLYLFCVNYIYTVRSSTAKASCIIVDGIIYKLRNLLVDDFNLLTHTI